MELTGRMLGHYLVAEEISRGGMGVVYRATDTRLNRDVALKVLPQEVTNDDDVRRRFLKEAQAASALEHPHIAVIHGADEVDGIAYIAMELIRGEKLSDLLARQRLPVARSLELSAEVAAGLARAHEKGIVHRDLKPSNVMVTDEGHAKIIDFGIAKLIEVSSVAAAQTRTGHDTGVGVVLGTMTYMSPEQARAETVDHRSDIFSFGILLHEMLAGQPPFRGKSGIETASAILHEPAPRLPALGPAVIAEAGADIQRIVDKCLAKDPADRYQGMKDLVVDIRAARRRLDTGPQAAAATKAAATVPAWGWLAAAVAVAAIAGVVLFNQREDNSNTTAATTGSGKPSVAVLYFDNTTGDKELDWMRTGITEMVVTDLSQSQGIEVVGTDRLYGILAELKRQDDRMMSPEAISEVAARTGVTNVVVGSYVRSGDAIRINVRLQEAKTGRIISSERVDGTSTSALFSMIDDLSSRIRAKFEGLRAEASILTAPSGGPVDNENRGVEEVTTTSIDAYRFYAEGLVLNNRRRDAEALAMFEKAVAIDPLFAMAYGKMAVVEGNRGNFDRRSQYGAKAFSLADRLTPRDRAYIEAVHYANSPGDIAKSIAAYQRCLAIDSAHESCRNNLGLAYLGLERFADAVAQFEQLIQADTTIVQPYLNITFGYRALGQAEKAVAVTDAFARRSPENAAGHIMLGVALIAVGRHDDAFRALEKAGPLDLIDSGPQGSMGTAHLLREDWKAAAIVADALANGPTEAHRWFGAQVHVALSGFAGESAVALTWAERAAAAYKVRGQRSAIGHELVGLTLLARGQHGAAAAAMTQAVADAKGTAEEPTALLYQAWALAAARRPAEAEASVAALVSKANPLSTVRDGRLANTARGLVALGRGEPSAAVKPLQDAAAALTPRGIGPNQRSWHLPVWSALGQALLDAGRPGEARPWFEKVAASGYERARQPIDFVRSFYFLGRIYEQQGDTAKSREAYRRFVGYWKDGDLDRDRVAEAQRKISG
jgi:TolB-like protein/tetratricopeptide (TPR) repeat protein/predicted Ser/Thr protein kinase